MPANTPPISGHHQSSSFVHKTSQPSNLFARFLEQSYCIIPSFTLESGVTLSDVPVAYKTFGQLAPSGDNVMVICHALTGSADVGDWWEPLLGQGRALDTSRFYIICLNNLGSPYGSVSPVTINPESGDRYGPEFPLTTIRDDARIHKLVVEDLGIKQVAVVIGGSLGGMICLEWAYFGSFVRSIVPLATSARHSAWGISWGEAQRQSIYSDPIYDDGYYDPTDQPVAGLSAARMSALLTYRSRNSFESRFGRNTPDPSRLIGLQPDVRPPSTPSEEHWANHNEGFKAGRKLQSPPRTPVSDGPNRKRTTPMFSAQTYLRYQAEKFVKRFDANCYIATTRKMDTHDVSRGRAPDIKSALGMITQPTLVVGIESDGLFTYAEQQELAEHIPNARLSTIYSPEGHDAFLVEFKVVNEHIVGFLYEVLPEIMNRSPVGDGAENCQGVGEIKKTSFFGEAEVDGIVSW